MDLHGLFVTMSSLVVIMLGSLVVAQNGPTNWTVSPFPAPGLPLAVRSPYLNSWLPQGNDPLALNAWWANLGCVGCPFTGWLASVFVDGIAYRIAGNAIIPNLTTGKQTAVEFTPTQTSFLYTAGPMQINLTYISPIEPTDLVRQSLPFSYLTMSAISTDGNAHTLQMYSDITGEFITGDDSKLAQWSAEDDDPYIVLQMSLQTQQKYTEIIQTAQDATEFYALKKIDGATTSWGITYDVVNRGMAVNGTTLLNSSDTNFRAVNDNWPTLGIAVDWGTISQTPEPAVWAVGVIRAPSIQYRASTGSIEERYPYFMSTYADGNTAAKAFLDDFPRALSAAVAFDTKISLAGNTFSSDYADLLSLSARQAIGALDITLAKNESGSWNMSDVKVFMKNMGGAGSDAGGSTFSVNTVDIMYAAFPMFMYLNPELGGYLLSPLIEYQDSTAYLLSYAAKNIGSSYPNATADGINDAHNYGIEETANMLIMTLAYSQRSGNGTFISNHYTLLRKWAEYLGENAQTPTSQKSADSISSQTPSINNQTNLALKGIIGIACMAEIAKIAGVTSDQEQFNSTASSYISQWQNNALALDNSHVDFIYGQSDTNGLIYNLFADKLLQLNLVSDLIYEVMTAFYNNIAGQSTYGIPLDNNDSGKTSTYWMMFAASTVRNSETQSFMISLLHKYASSSQNNTQFPSVYNPASGIASSVGSNSPASGSIYSLLALNTIIQSSITLPSEGSTNTGSNTSSEKPRSKVGPIVGGTLGGISLIPLLLLGIAHYLRLRRRNKQKVQQRYVEGPYITQRGSIVSSQILDAVHLEGLAIGRRIIQRVNEKILHRSDAANTDRASSSDSELDSTARNEERSRGFVSTLGADREQLREENENLRLALKRLAQRRNTFSTAPPPSYSEPRS